MNIFLFNMPEKVIVLFLRFWSLDGELLCSTTPIVRVLSPLTAVCCDEYADHLVIGDASKKGLFGGVREL